MTGHQHRWFTEQQTGHTFCEMCGKHDPPSARCGDRPSALWATLTDPAYRAALAEAEADIAAGRGIVYRADEL